MTNQSNRIIIVDDEFEPLIFPKYHFFKSYIVRWHTDESKVVADVPANSGMTKLLQVSAVATDNQVLRKDKIKGEQLIYLLLIETQDCIFHSFIVPFRLSRTLVALICLPQKS